MKTIDLTKDNRGTVVTLELNEDELATLVALVEQGQQQLHGRPPLDSLHRQMSRTAEEFRSLLGHLELLPADN